MPLREATQREIQELLGGAPRPGSLREATPEEAQSIAAALPMMSRRTNALENAAELFPEISGIPAGARAAEPALGRFLDPLLRAQDMHGLAGPGLGITGEDAAETLLSRETGRAAVEGGAAAVSAPFTGGLSIPVRAGISALASGAGSYLASQTVDPVENPHAEALFATGAGFAAELGAGAFIRASRGGTRLMKPTDRAALQRLERMGVMATPGQVSANPWVRMGESLAESGTTGGAALYETRQAAEQAVQDAAQQYVNGFLRGADPVQVGELARDVLLEGRRSFGETARALYAKVDDALRGRAAVDLKPALALANELVEKHPRSAEVRQLRDWIQKESQRYGEGAVAWQGKSGFAEAQQLRSDLLAATGAPGGGGLQIAGQAEGVAKRLAKAVDDAMDAAAREVDGPAALAWRDANRFYKQGKETWNSATMRAIANAQPEQVYNIAIKNATPAGVERMKKILDPRSWQAMQGQFMDDLLRSSLDADGNVSGKKLLALINRTHGDRKMQAVLGGKWQEWRGIANALEVTQRGTGQYIPGGVRMKWGQLGLTLALAAQDPTDPKNLAGAAFVLTGPAALSRAFRSPGFAKWLTLGLRSKPGSPLAVRAFGQLGASFANMDDDTAEDR